MIRAEKRRQQKLAKKATKRSPDQQSPANQKILNLAVQHHNAGRLSEAENLYRRILQTDPNHPNALHLLGVIAHQIGKSDIAVDLIKKSLAIKPDVAEAHNDLGAALHELKRLDGAVASYRKALRIKPDVAEAHCNLGNTYKELGRLEEAVSSCQEALAIKPDFAVAHSILGYAFRKLGRLEEAVTSCEKALSIRPGYVEASITLSQTLYGISVEDAERARKLALHFIQAFPKDDVLRRGVSGIAESGDCSVEADRLYSTIIFDNFARTFDDTLEDLHYDMPEKLTRAACPVDGGADLDILDAGCGTGLCGVHLRTRARHLVGVDLSTNMLAEARAKKLYDSLVEADLVNFMENNPAGFDIVLSADVLIYIGEIAPLVQAAYLALRPGGVCAVSVESLNDDAGTPYLLAPSGRYQHTGQYVREAFTAAGFTVDALQKTSVRLENTVPIPALIVVARKG
jgi:predicted TPR repeat methyltransferase/Flp pilus assembly protein TadD